MKKNDALKKHHFWILLGLVPLCVLIAVLVVSSSVGGAIGSKEAAIDKDTKEIAGKTSPKPDLLIKKMEKSIEFVKGKQGGLHQDNWERQKAMFTWPNSPKLKEIERMGLRFGAKIPNDRDQYEEFRKKEVYLAEYSNAEPNSGKPGTSGMADRVAPTQFAGGWERVLRHVNSWTDVQTTSEQIWLMLEDIWVQRSMLDAIRAVNADMAEFHRIKYEKAAVVIDDPDPKAPQKDALRRKFKSRTWEVAIEVAKKGNRQYLIGTLTNTTDRLQLLGAGKALTLKVWLEGKPGADGKPRLGPDGKPDVDGIEPVEFRVGGEFVPGVGGTKTVKVKDGKDVTIPANVVFIQPDESNEKNFDRYPNFLPPGKNAIEIVRVEQVFDPQTVPVRYIEKLALGFPDSRNKVLPELKLPNFAVYKQEADAAAAAATTTTDSSNPSGSSQGPMPMSFSQPGREGDMGTGTGIGTSGRGAGGGGPIAAVIDGNKKRYIDATDHVRRMPVGIVVIVDQAHLQDVLLAFANSPLRFQITQVNWSRYRGPLGAASGTSGSSSAGGDIVFSGEGNFGIGIGEGDPDGPSFGPGRMQPPPGPLTPGVGGGSSQGPPPMPGPRSPGVGGSSPLGPPVGGTGYNPYGPPAGGTMTTVSDAQLTSGLIQLSVYGVVSLYEKYPLASPEGSAVVEADSKVTEKEKDGKDEEPKGGTPKDAIVPGATTPKKRVRRGR